MRTKDFQESLKKVRDSGHYDVAQWMELAYDLWYSAAMHDYWKIESKGSKIRI